MKMGGGGEIPEPEIDEFGNEVVKPIIVAEYVRDGVLIQELENHGDWSAYTKQLERNRDQALLKFGIIDQAGLRRKNGFLEGLDPSRFRIVAVGDRKYKDID